MDLKPLWDNLHAGKLEEVYREVLSLCETSPTDELFAVKAWCHYRRGEFGEAWSSIEQANGHTDAEGCRLYVLAYSKDHRDDKRLMTLCEERGVDLTSVNALLIRARMPDAVLDHERVLGLVTELVENVDATEHRVAVANALHNTARFFHARARGRQDLKFALGLLDTCLGHYGDTSNWHHRAAAHFWRSQVLEALTLVPEAFQSAVVSLQYWQAQCQLEKDTAPFADKLENAVVRVTELAGKVKLFALRRGTSGPSAAGCST